MVFLQISSGYSSGYPDFFVVALAFFFFSVFFLYFLILGDIILNATQIVFQDDKAFTKKLNY